MFEEDKQKKNESTFFLFVFWFLFSQIKRFNVLNQYLICLIYFNSIKCVYILHNKQENLNISLYLIELKFSTNSSFDYHRSCFSLFLLFLLIFLRTVSKKREREIEILIGYK